MHGQDHDGAEQQEQDVARSRGRRSHGRHRDGEYGAVLAIFMPIVYFVSKTMQATRASS
ncbi:hypothetical protein LHK_03153 [Laribacter hongkongensis HLHK9]|uniref:Uncharacterized protein n=1 Tax=Laribacter hongkongensis (strain HLHK9) TaxID=557598 RepID=C1D696_LARHH|nr:hypothetical protein LHK_03153 [Laribacter hongkongensis HLHK9]